MFFITEVTILPISLIYLGQFSEGEPLTLDGDQLYSTEAISSQAVSDIIAALPEAHIEKLRKDKRKEIDRACVEDMHSGFTLNGFGYKSTPEAQSDYIGLSDMSKTTLEGYPIRRESGGVWAVAMHTPLEIKDVMTAGLNWKYQNLAKLGVLDAKVDAAQDQAAIDLIFW